MRHRRDADAAPVRVVRELPRRLAGKAARRDLAEAQAVERVPDLLRLEREREARHADVGGLAEHGRQRNRAEVVLVGDRGRADLHVARAGVDDAAGAKASRGQAGGHEEGLDARARLEQVEIVGDVGEILAGGSGDGIDAVAFKNWENMSLTEHGAVFLAEHIYQQASPPIKIFEKKLSYIQS